MDELSKDEILQLMRMRHSLRATYLMWRNGIDPKYTVARETYHKHKIELSEKYNIDINQAWGELRQ